MTMIERVARALRSVDLAESARMRPSFPADNLVKIADEAEAAGAYRTMAQAAIAAMPIDEGRQIIEAFVAQEVDYMTRNSLGDPEQQHNVKWARKWLAALTEEQS